MNPDEIEEDLPDLEIHPLEYVCPACRLIHWGPPRPEVCDFS